MWVTVTAAGQNVPLTAREFEILALLMEHPKKVFTREQIYEQVWKDVALGSENTVAVHIRHLRQKIEKDPGQPQLLLTVRGIGYKLAKEESA